MTLHRHAVIIALAGFGALPDAARAQQPIERQVDSLAAEIRVLKARLDSLRAQLARTQGAVPARAAKDTAAARDELAALRAAAAAAAGVTDTTAKRDTTPVQFVGRERNQSQLNPEISVTGDVRASGQTPGVQRDNFDPREFEFAFQSALDPFSHTKIFVSIENGDVDIEEGYAYWTGLPGRIRVDVGKFRQQIGELNRWHLHALPETEYPLALTESVGEDGLIGTGVSFYRAFGGFGTHEVTAQITRSASDEELFAGSGRPTYLLHLLNFWQLNRSSYMQLGATGLYGTNPDSSLLTYVGGLDWRFSWAPPARALYRGFTARTEVLALRKRIAGVGPTRLGGYVSSSYKLGQRWIAGLRYDQVEEPLTGLITRQVVPSLTLWQSEWVMLRGQYRWAKTSGLRATNQIVFQAVWAVGPHKHETY